MFIVLSSPNQYQVSPTSRNPPPCAWIFLPVVSFQNTPLLNVTFVAAVPSPAPASCGVVTSATCPSAAPSADASDVPLPPVDPSIAAPLLDPEVPPEADELLDPGPAPPSSP